ncbi:kelch-like protein 4 [Dendronephthya gigantea]|uniref:kelch-like protein 4 n=1 Tax=Dendronephthya gigantea TaxID=151771 RepID=UPI00106C9386|nr:kelch-like protein 4 [Dendronephthya gigantea]
MASYTTGYDDERFEQIVSQTLHCIICTNVIKDPVMCRHNEHVFCRGCIIRHLMNSQTCPTCMEPLTVDTLKVPRNIANLISELKIRCEFFERGCERFILLGDLEKHVADCGFAPVFCSNEGCGRKVNKQDLLHHETALCELRRVKCHSCNDIRQEMDTVKSNLAAIEVKVDSINEKIGDNDTDLKSIAAKVELVQEQQKESNRQLKADNEEMKKLLSKMERQLERIVQQTSCDVEQRKKGIAEADEMSREPKVVVVGGASDMMKLLNSVEMFSFATKTWTPLQRTKECRDGASSVVHDNQIFVVGGDEGNSGMTSIEKLSLKAVHVDQSINWEKFPAELREPIRYHRTVIYNGRLITIGGDGINSDRISEISLVLPYNRKVLATMLERKRLHGVALFGDKIIIVGGFDSERSVLEYDITKSSIRRMNPLPYDVFNMAMVKWGDNLIVLGGYDKKEKQLSKVLMYDIQSEKSFMLPEMLHKRNGCVAAVVGDTVVVMGGEDGHRKYLKSVEAFRFDRFSWEELPEMHEARLGATAVVC